MTISDIIARNKAKGFYFFSPDTMAFFMSRVCDWVFEDAEHCYFGTSERMGDVGTPRTFGVRIFSKETGSVWSPYPMTRYRTERQARLAAMEMAGQSTPQE